MRRRLWRLVLALAAAVFARGNPPIAADLAHARIVVDGGAASWTANRRMRRTGRSAHIPHLA